MRKITLLVLFCCTHLMMLAQTKSTNTNEAPARIKCYTTEYMAELRRANPRMQTDEQFEQFMAAAIVKRKSDIERGVVQPLAGPYVINVIVHVLHSGQAVGTYPNLSQIQVASQIRVLNEDFNRTNQDAVNTPAVFLPVAGSVSGTAPAGGGIVFQLARQDPAGNLLAEAGVHRYQIPAAASYTTAFINGTVKPATSWDNSRYMNMWTINAPTSGGGALYGYAQFPDGSGLAGLSASGGASNTDGLVMAADAFGSNYTATGALLPVGQRYQFSAGADKGRTATHELGHGLGLRHIWGDGACASDFCADTPVAAGANTNPCYVHPKNSTCAGLAPEMFMNYMDYTLDACMNIFTQDQMTRMVTVMNVSPGRNTLTTATVGNCPTTALGLTRPTGAYPNAGQGQTYNQANVGTGGGTPNPATGAGYVYVLTGTLPAGLTLNASTGVISGVASAVGTSNFSITPNGAVSFNAAGAIISSCAGAAVAYSIQVVPSSCPAITILPAAGALPNAAPGVAYSQPAIAASGGVAPYTYTISSGALPTGFTLSAGGVISGTSAGPQAAVSFTVLATDASTPAACQALINYTLAVVAPVCVPTAVVSTYPYIQNFDAITGATAAIAPLPAGVGVVTNSAMPCGWSVHNQNGDTRTFNTYNVGFADTSPNSGTNAMIYIYNTASAADDWAITQGFVMNAGQTYNVALQYRVSASGGTTYPENFQVRWGNAQTVAAMTAGTQLFTTPPAGATNLTYQATTPMTITPTVTGTYYIGIQANSTADQYFLAIDDFSVTTVACPTPPTVTSTPVASALSYTVGTAIPSITMSATPAATYTYSITAGALPAGVTMTPAGVISGTPTTVAASGTFTVTATNGACTGTKVFTFSVAACPVTFTPATGATLTAATLGVAYPAFTITQTGVSTPATFSATGLPAGMVISAGGTISGTPTAGGSFTVAVSVTNGTCTGSASYTLVVACPTITLTPATGATLAAGVVGATYAGATITSNVAGVTFTATGLPAGLSISTTGAISGTPTAVATSTVIVTATSGTCSGTATYTLVTACPTATITPATGATLTAGVVGATYTATITSNLSGAIFTATGLPAGLSISGAGAISGTPSAVATSTVVVTATLGVCSVSGSYTLVTACPTATITPATGATLTAGVVGATYTATITSNLSGATFTATGLPVGLSISGAGAITGTPSAVATSTVVVTATLGVCTISGSYTLVTACPVATITPATGATLVAGVIGIAYTANITSNLSGATFAATGLPAGLSISGAGAITGTPTAVATSTVVVTATLGTCTVSGTYTLATSCPTITFTPAAGALAGGSIGTAYTASVSASPSGTTLTATGLPAGLSMTSAGAISGTPTGTPTTASVVVTATFGTCPIATSNYTIVIGATLCTPVVITQTTLPNGTVGLAYAPIQLTATGGSANTTFTFTPANAFATTGLSMSSTGLISGTPTFSTSVTVSITATNGTGCNGVRSLTLVTLPNPATAINGTLSNEVKVYPNPSKADFNVDFASLNLGKVAIRVYDVQGKQVFTTSTSDNTTVISLEKFAKGMYLMEIDSQKGRILKRIVKE